MSKLSKLLQVTDDEKKAILESFNINEKEFDENVRRLKEWASQCEHLPQESGDNKFKVSLLNSKMSLEKAKQMIEGYYRIRTIYSNEFFDRLVPNTDDYILGKRFVKTVVMPKLTPNLCRITIFKMSDPGGEAADAYMYYVMVLMMAELRIKNDFFVSNIILIDFDDYGWKNLIKFTPVINQKLITIMNAISLRIQGIHFVNLSNIIEHVMRILRAVLPDKMVHKIHSHKTLETLWEQIPKEYLPSNYGGTEKSVEEIYEEWCQQIEESEDLFTKLLNEKSTEKFELDPYQKDLYGIGMEGSFKKLAVD